MEIAAIRPQWQLTLPGVPRPDHTTMLHMPAYRPPRWRCDGCGLEVEVPDYSGYSDRYSSDGKTYETAPEPVGWFILFEHMESANRIAVRSWRFCSLACVATCRTWTSTAQEQAIVNAAREVEALTECIETVATQECWRIHTARWEPPLYQTLQEQRGQALARLEALCEGGGSHALPTTEEAE